jgi:glucose 1-dehydrogenase
VNVAVNYVGRPEGAEATKEAIERGVQTCMEEVEAAGARALLVAADVSKEDEVETMFQEVAGKLGTPDFLVNNAGIQISEDSDALEPVAFDRVLAVNLRGSFLCAQRAIRQLPAEDRPGAIVNVSSVHQVIPKPRFLG